MHIRKIELLCYSCLYELFRGTKESRSRYCKWLKDKLTRKKTEAILYKYEYLLHKTSSYEQKKADRAEKLKNAGNILGHYYRNTQKVFIFSVVPAFDSGGGQRSAQLAKTFSTLGYHVYYIYAFDSSESAVFKIIPNVTRHCSLNDYSVETFEADISAADTVIFELPYEKLYPYLVKANNTGCNTVYEHIDNWDSSLGCMFYNEKCFRQFVAEAKKITVTAVGLGEKIAAAGRRDFIYSPNAVDYNLFNPLTKCDMPSDLIKGEKTFVYFGSLWGDWFDWRFISVLAENSNYSVNLIGDCKGISAIISAMPVNVHFLGYKPQTELPAYLYYSDYTLLPFKNDSIGKYVSPLKVFEYIAMNKPVLATELPEISGYPGVFCSDNPSDWLEIIKHQYERNESFDFVLYNNWFYRCSNMLCRTVLKKDVSLSVIILNRNNTNTVFSCIDSVLKFSESYDTELIIVDNQSSDGSYEKIRDIYKDSIILLRNGKNGCSSGRNIGVKAACGEWLFFLDSDQIIMCDNYLDNAIRIINSDNSVNAVGWAAGWFGKKSCFGPISDYYQNRAIESYELYRTDIDYLGTDGMLIRKDVFDRVGGFDEAYDPTGFEDSDFSMKLKSEGYGLAYCPCMPILHFPHQTTGSAAEKLQSGIISNEKYFAEKWFGKKEHLNGKKSG